MMQSSDDSSNVMHVYTDTVQYNPPSLKPYDVTYPNQVIMKRTMISASLPLSRMKECVPLFLKNERMYLSLSLAHRRKTEVRDNVDGMRAHLFSVLCCFLVECRSVLAVLVGLVISARSSQLQRIRVGSLGS
jgi:hypothetical protein